MQPPEETACVSMRDPVCGAEIARDRALLITEHDGTTYPFCSEGCRMLFALHPESFAAEAARPASRDVDCA